MKHCILIENTRNGYILAPRECRSIAEAIRTAREDHLAFRIYVNGELYKSGWFID